MLFNIKDFHNKSVTKFFYEKGRHASTSLRDYRDKLFVHKLLGSHYSGVTKQEYKELISQMNDVSNFFVKNTTITFPRLIYLGYDSENNCIERIEEYSGNTLAYIYPTAASKKRDEILNVVLEQIKSLVHANHDNENLDYSIDPTPDNFTYDGNDIHYIDFMPPLVRTKSINSHFISDKSRNTENIAVQMARYFTQKGMYLTFLIKFGASDISYFKRLFDKTLNSIENINVITYIDNELIKKITDVIKNKEQYFTTLEKINSLINSSEAIERDFLRLIGLYFITDGEKIRHNANKYRIEDVVIYMQDKRCTSDVVKGLIYSDLRSPNQYSQLKNIVIKLIALQYGQ